jgi:hypothetical protein
MSVAEIAEDMVMTLETYGYLMRLCKYFERLK